MSKFNLILGVALVALLLGYNTLFTVDERERAILFRFGEIVRADYEPGIHFKLPLVHQVALFSRQIQTLDGKPVRYQTEELKNVIVDAFVKWRIADVEKFYISV
ncbi:MAG TPA: protease modulator HflC, partial [Gammaproteobacteria bacterium]|nr:protease modulator HflC [Gammaproteobacteria bacterium]